MKTPNELQIIAAIGRRLIENPQLAADLLLALHSLVDRDFRVVNGTISEASPEISYVEIQNARRLVALATGQTQAAAAHYAKQAAMALEISDRTGEELLPEHFPADTVRLMDEGKL